MITFETFFESNDKPLAPVLYIGRQENGKGGYFDLFVADGDKIPGVASYSSITRMTLEKMGYYVPPIPKWARRDDPVSRFEDRMPKPQFEAAPSKNNPFGYDRIKKITKHQPKLPRKTFHHDLKAKQKKSEKVAPRTWKLNALGTLKRFFERTDPDIMHDLLEKDIITFTLIPGIGYYYASNVDVKGNLQSVYHSFLKRDIRVHPVVAAPNKIKIVYNYQEQHYVYLGLLPGKGFKDILANLANDRNIEGRIHKSEMATWAARPTFEKYGRGLWEKLCDDLKINPIGMTYNFAEIGDLPYKLIYDSQVQGSEARRKEMDLLRQVHLNPAIKKAVLANPSRDKADHLAKKSGMNSKAEFNTKRTLGDSVNS